MPGGMQLAPRIKQALDPRFLAWYLQEFRLPRMGYVHWSAGRRDQNWPEYHVVVTFEHGQVVVHRNTPCYEDLHAHTYQRNTDSFAVCVASMYGATTKDFGVHAPTPEQVRALADELTRICCNLRVPVGHVLTHAEAADNRDGAPGLDYYGPTHGCERWDFWVWIDPVTLHIHPRSQPGPTLQDFGDWLRGEVIRGIAKATEPRWKH